MYSASNNFQKKIMADKAKKKLDEIRKKPKQLSKPTPQSNTLLTKNPPKANRNKPTSPAAPMHKGKRGKGNGARPSDIGIDRWNWMNRNQ